MPLLCREKRATHGKATVQKGDAEVIELAPLTQPHTRLTLFLMTSLELAVHLAPLSAARSAAAVDQGSRRHNFFWQNDSTENRTRVSTATTWGTDLYTIKSYYSASGKLCSRSPKTQRQTHVHDTRSSTSIITSTTSHRTLTTKHSGLRIITIQAQLIPIRKDDAITLIQTNPLAARCLHASQ